MSKIQIRGLDGIYGLPEATRRSIITDYTNQGLLRNDNSLDRVNRLYRNRQFVDIFGEDIFRRLNVQQRDEMLDRHFLQMEAARRFSPYHRRDKNGKIISDSKTPLPGVGMSPENYETLKTFSNETLRNLLEDDGFTPSNQIRSSGEVLDEAVAKTNLPDWQKAGLLFSRGLMKLVPVLPNVIPGTSLNDMQAELSRKHNDNLFEKYKTQDVKRIEQNNVDSINDEASLIRNNTNETQRQSDFMSMINSEYNPGFANLAALFDEEGNPKKTAARVMTDDDRTEFLAKYIAMSKVMTPEQLQTYIRNEVANYILDHESRSEKLRKDTQEVGITAASYGAAQLNSFRMAAKMFQSEVNVYMTEDGEIIPTRKVGFENDKPYTYRNGNKVPLIATKMQPTTLDYLGKDTMGEDYSWLWNNAYWRDVERFNVFDEEEIARAKKRGASDMSQVYRDGATSSIPFEVAKMSGFAMMDGAMLIFPTVGGQLAKGIGAIGKAGTRLNKVAQVLSKGTDFITKYTGGTASALGIGHDYANNAFAENLESNLLQLNTKVMSDAQNVFLDKYSNEKDDTYRNLVDARMQEIANSIVEENPGIDPNKAVMLAKDQVMQEFVELEEKQLKSDAKYNYGEKLKQAHETASDAAIAMFTTDALKYFAVNHFAFRKVLFRTPKQNLESFLRNEGKNVIENDALRIEGNQPLTRAQKLKFLGKTTASQIWGGAWTNYTDEMQMWGNRYLNNDSYKRYLDGDYTNDGLFKMLIGADSFLNGFMHAPVEKTTTMAGVVGGLGGAFGIGLNMAGAATMILSKEGRAQAKYYLQKHDRDYPERELPKSAEKPKLTRDAPSFFGMFINNGILNNYNGFKNSNRDINRYVKTINNWLDNSDNMAAVRKLYELDLASMDTTNPTDEAVVDLFKMLNAFSTLDNINQIGDKGSNPTIMDMVANQSTIIREAKELTQKILQGIDEQQASEMLDDYFAQNKGLVRNEQTEAEAIQAIVNNANEIKRAKELYDEAFNRLRTLEKMSGESFDQTVRGKYIESYVLDRYLTNQINQQERTILGEETQTESGNILENPINLDAIEDAPHEVYGGKQSKKNYIKSLDKEIAEIDSKLEQLSKEIAEKEKERKESSSKEHKKELKKQRKSDRKVNKTLDEAADPSLDKEIFKAKTDYEYYERAKEVREKLKNKLQEALDNTEDNKKPKILTKDQIMRLDPESRARMLSPYNRHNYTKAQQKVIDKVISELTKKDPNLLNLIFKQAADVRRARANEELLNEISISPERAAGVYTAIINSNKLTIPQNFYYYNAEIIDQAIRDQIEYNPAFGTMQIKKAEVYNSLINSAFDAQTLRGILDLDEIKKFGTIEQYRSDIERAANTIEARTKVQTEINKLEIGDNTKKELLDNAMPIVRDAVDLQDAIDKLSEVANSSGVAEAQRQLFQTVVDKLKALKSQGEAVIAETKPQAEVREERKADERQDAEDRERKAKEEQERRNAEAREQAKIAIESYKAWSDEHVTIDKENHVYYVDGEPIDYSVTDYYEKEISRKKFPDIYKFAGPLGDGFDAIGRDYFNFIFGRGEDPSTKTYVNYPDTLRDKIIDYFKQMHEEFVQKFGENYYAITDTITFVCNFDNNGRRNSIAGTPDMIIVDEQGRVNIVDFKLKREQNFGDWSNDLPYNFQQNGYRQMWEFLTEGKFPVNDIYLMWAKQHYPSEAKETTINGEKKRYHYEVTNKETGEITIFELRPATNKEISKDAARPQSQKQLVTIQEKHGTVYRNVHYAKVETGMKMTDFAENGNWSIDKPILVEIKERSNPLNDLSEYDKTKSEGKPKEEPKPEVVTTINTTRFNTTTNREYKGNYQVTKNPDNSFVIDFEGPAEAMHALGKQGLGELNLDFNDLVDKSDPIYDKITALFVSEVNVDPAGRVTLTVNFITPTETNKVVKRTIGGNNAALIFNKLFGEDVNNIIPYTIPESAELQDDNQTEVAQNQEDEAIDMPPEHIEMGEDGGHTQSPDGEEQLKDALEEGLDVQHANLDENSSRETGLADIGSANDNLTEEQQDFIFQGNPFFTYDGNVLRNEGRREKRQPDKPDDRFDTIKKWLSNLQDADDSSVVGVQLQEIIDTELNDIIKVEPTIRVMTVNNHADNTNTSDKNKFIIDTPFLCVEYTDKVKKIHTKGGKNFGGVFTAETLENGEPVTKKYLMVGIAGFHRNNPAYTSWWNDGLQVERWSHVSEASNAGRPAQRFYVSPNHKTEVQQIGGGWKVTRSTDGKQTFRDPLELINDPRRNPKGIKSLADLKWGIVFYKEGLITTGLADKTVHAPREILTNLGSAFLMLETANGDYIPIFVQPAKFNDIRNGEIKSMIETKVRSLINPDYNSRAASLEELRQLIVLQESTMNRSEDRPFDISIGDPSNNTIKIKSGNVTVETIDINSPDAAEQLMNAIRSIDPRINITLKALSNPVMVKHLNDAGALKTDLEMLATSNADFTVYPMIPNGRMYVPTEFKPSEPKETSEAQKDAIAAFRQGRSVTFNSILYRMNDENKWVEAETGKVVTNPALLDQITKRNYIISNNLDPNYEDSTGKYYIINSDKQHNEVWKYTQKSGKESVVKLSVTDGFQIIQKVAADIAEANRQEAARQKLEEVRRQEEEIRQRKEEQKPRTPTEQELGQQAIKDNSLEVFSDRNQGKEDHSKFMPPEDSAEEKKPKQQRSNKTLEELQNQKRTIRESWQDSSSTGVAFRTEVISIFADKGLIDLNGRTPQQLAEDAAELKRLKIGSKLEKIAKGKEKINGKKYIYDPNVTTIDNWLEILRKC